MARVRGVLIQGIFYMLLVVVLCVFLILTYFSSITFVDVIIMIIGVCAGLFAAYVIFHSLSHEKSVQFFPGEEPIMKSSGPGSYLVIKHIGDKVFEYDPLKADIYLTTLGIIAEAPESGTAIFYVPHDRILEYVAHESGILLHYIDVNDQFSEAIIFVEDRISWLNSMQSLYAKTRK